jgi:hypothetical protein
MSIEKIIVRTLIAVAMTAVILTLTFYPPSYAMMPLVFLFMCIMAEVALPKDSKKEKKGLPKTIDPLRNS